MAFVVLDKCECLCLHRNTLASIFLSGFLQVPSCNEERTDDCEDTEGQGCSSTKMNCVGANVTEPVSHTNPTGNLHNYHARHDEYDAANSREEK